MENILVNKWLMMIELKLDKDKTKLLEINVDNNATFKINNVTIVLNHGLFRGAPEIKREYRLPSLILIAKHCKK